MAFFATGGSVVTDGVTIKTNASGQIYVDSSNVVPVEEIAQQSIEIIELQANASVTPLDHDTLISDTFSDDDGYRNTVQTGTTDAAFDTDRYKRTSNIGSEIDSPNSPAHAANDTTVKAKIKYLGSSNFVLTKIRYSTDTGTATVLIKDATETNTLFTQVDNSASEDRTLDLIGCPELTKNVYYIVIVTVGVGTNLRGSTSAYDQTANNMKVEKNGSDNVIGSLTGTPVMFTFAETSSVTKIIDIDLGTITGTVTSTELVIRGAAETGSSITYKLKNATQNDDALAINTKNAVVNLTTVPTGIEIQENPKSSSPTDGNPYVNSFCLKLWKA